MGAGIENFLLPTHILRQAQAMQEKMVDVECIRYDIPKPFMVLATQNPIEQIGTYPLAEAQVDRFMVKYDIGYPDNAEETALIVRKNSDFDELKAGVKPVTTPEDILAMQRVIHDDVRVSRKIMDYIVSLCTITRPPKAYTEKQPDMAIYKYIRLGSSPRASENILALSKANAFFHGRDFVNFDDIVRCAAHVLRHRILLNSTAISKQITSDMIIDEIIRTVKPY